MIPAVYSLSWAWRIVEQLESKYPRATEEVYAILGLTTKNMAVLLATKDPLFPDLRNLIHFVDNCGRPLQELYSREGVVNQVRLYWRCKSKLRVEKRLDELWPCGSLKEQESRGGG